MSLMSKQTLYDQQASRYFAWIISRSSFVCRVGDSIHRCYSCNFCRKCCVGVNKFLEYSGTEGRSDTSTAFKLLLADCRSEHVQLPPGGGGGGGGTPLYGPYGGGTPGGGCWGAPPLYGLYGDVPLERVWFSSSLSVYNFARVCPTQGIQFRISLS